MCNSIPANSSKVCNGNGKCVSVDKCECNDGFIGKYCDNNCNSLYYYIDLTNTLNKTLYEINFLYNNLNITNRNLT
jgi:hypothetical protein